MADIMTKPLKLDTFLTLRKSLGVCAECDINRLLFFSLREDLLVFYVFKFS